MRGAPMPAWLAAHLGCKVQPPVRTPRVVLSVDQATESGWCLHSARRYVESGHLDLRDWTARAEVFSRAHQLSDGEPYLFAFEDHAAMPLKSYKTAGQLIALGIALGQWLDSLNRTGHLDTMVLGVSSRDWRRRVLGADERAGRAALKRHAVQWAQAYTGRAALRDDNEAEAIALGAFASLEPLVETHPRTKQRARRCAFR